MMATYGSVYPPHYSDAVSGICRHFLNGSCRYGTRCRYIHEWSVAQSAQICRYYQKGCCWYGERCRYRHIPLTEGDAFFTSRRSSVPQVHVSTSNGLPSRRGSEPALSQARGIVNGDLRESHAVFSPQHVHTSTQGTRDHLLKHDADLEACQELLQSSDVSHACAAKGSNEREPSKEDDCGGAAAASGDLEEETEAFLQSKEVTCGICMDKVYEKRSAAERRFAILPSCSHSFCLRCIVTWRKTKDLQEEVIKSCPQCRVKSAFYVPHNYWVEGPAKEMLIASFKEKCSKIRCSYFMRHGCCPFKSECIYWHDETQRRQTDRWLQTEDLEDIDDPIQLLDFVMSISFLADLNIDDDDDDDDDYGYGGLDDALYFHLRHDSDF